jgi:hypothetical protein
MIRCAFVIITVLCGTFAHVAQAGITVTSPVGGEVWAAGSEVSVTWTHSAPTHPGDEIAIFIRDGVDGPGATIRFNEGAFRVTVTAGDGQATFSVPTWLGDGSNYFVEVRSIFVIEPIELGASDGPIAIVGSDSLRRLELRLPLSDARWRAGRRAFVAWDAVGASQIAVDLTLQPGNVQYPAVPANDGSAIVEIPEDIGNGNDFRLLLMEDIPVSPAPGQAFAFDESPPFEISHAASRPTLTITSPDGSETLVAGSEALICWETTAGVGRLAATILDGVALQGTYLSGADVQDGCVSRQICPYADGSSYHAFGATDTATAIDVFRGGYVQTVDLGDPFTIEGTALEPTLTLTTQNDGTTLAPNQQYAVSWTSSGFEGDEFLAAYLVSTSESTQTIDLIGATRVSNGTLTTRRFCPSLEEGASYRVRICVSSDYCPEICDESDMPFAITPIVHAADFTIVGPEGGSLFRDGQTVTFEYEATGVSGLTMEVRTQVGENIPNVFESAPAVNGAGSLSDRIRLPYGEIASRAYRLVGRVKSGNCTIVEKETDFFTVKDVECTCADIDGDLLVNLTDLGYFVPCLGTNPSSLRCICSDFDGSDAVDLRDFATFQNLFGVGDAAEPPNCPS